MLTVNKLAAVTQTRQADVAAEPAAVVLGIASAGYPIVVTHYKPNEIVVNITDWETLSMRKLDAGHVAALRKLRFVRIEAVRQYDAAAQVATSPGEEVPLTEPKEQSWPQSQASQEPKVNQGLEELKQIAIRAAQARTSGSSSKESEHSPNPSPT